MAIIIGFSIIRLSDQLLLPHVYVSSGSHQNNLFGYLAMAASSMVFMTGAVPIKDSVINLWRGWRRR